MLNYSNGTLKFSGGLLNPIPGIGPVPTYTVSTTAIHGTVIAVPPSGSYGDLVTLSNTPDTDYVFDSYTIEGTNSVTGNILMIEDSNVSVTGNFNYVQPGYDSYVIHFTWSSNDNLNLAGLHVDSVQPSASDVTLKYYNGSWQTASAADTETAITWENNDQGKSFYCNAIDITFNSNNVPSTVQVKTGRYYGGGSMTVTMHVAGVKDGVETDLGYTSQTNAANLIYTVNNN
jgi:hypothetical protein